jgi:hypothetical protein
MDKYLLNNSCITEGFELFINESSDPKLSTVKFRGKFQEANAINKNKRLYPFAILDENVKKLLPIIEARGLVGELDHPTDSIVHFENCSHLITKLWWEGNKLMGEGEILNTPKGKILKNLVEGGVRWGISSRGVGNGRNDENGILVIGESYKLITFDVVVDPSTHAAFQEKITRKENYQPISTDFTKNVSKNESSCIDKINKDVLVAWLNGTIKEHTSSIKAKLK